jgi:hypothetical protein
MPGNKYYDLSSDNDVNEDTYYESESSSSEDDLITTSGGVATTAVGVSGKDPLWGRTVLHLDIDCFYVQAEEIERGLRDSGRPIQPLAIGQKHIIVSKFGHEIVYRVSISHWMLLCSQDIFLFLLFIF